MPAPEEEGNKKAFGMQTLQQWNETTQSDQMENDHQLADLFT